MSGDGQAVLGSFAIPADHPCLSGHFPGRPVVPGALLLDAALGLILARFPGATLAAPLAAKFTAPVLPGEEVCLGCRLLASGEIAFEGRVGPRSAFSGKLRLTTPPPPPTSCA